MRFIIIAALALSLAGCGWWGSDEPAPTTPTEPAPVTETTKPVEPDAIDKDGVYNTEPVRKELAKRKPKQRPAIKRPAQPKPVPLPKPAPAPKSKSCPKLPNVWGPEPPGLPLDFLFYR
jgi:hypothetical protein